jgi:hypothetical protein
LVRVRRHGKATLLGFPLMPHCHKSAADGIFGRLIRGYPAQQRTDPERSVVSIVFRTKDWVTIPELTGAWSLELTKDREDPKQVERHLRDLLIYDIINGRLDEAGPLVNDRRPGLRIILSEFVPPRSITGRELAPLISPAPDVLERFVVMKEAVLDFARRRKLPSPSWWAGPDSLSADSGAACPAIEVPDVPPNPAPTGLAKRPGRKPDKRNQVKDAMRKDIRTGRVTITDLSKMDDKDLAFQYEVNRETARKARTEVLSEMSQLSETQVPTITTNDN